MLILRSSKYILYIFIYTVISLLQAQASIRIITVQGDVGGLQMYLEMLVSQSPWVVDF